MKMFDWNSNTKIDATNEKAIDKAIKSVIEGFSRKTVKENLHVALWACLEHAIAHNSADKLTKLYHTLPATVNKAGIMTYVETFSSFKYLKNKNGEKMFLGRDKDGKKPLFWLDQKGADHPFWDMPEVKKSQERLWSPSQALDNLISHGIKAVKDGKLAEAADRMLVSYLAQNKTKMLEEVARMVKEAEAKAAPASNVQELDRAAA